MNREQIIDGLEKLRFFNQRAGRELWFFKSKQIQDMDIADADNILAEAIKATSSADGDAVSKNILKKKMQYYGFHAPDMTITEFVEDLPSAEPKIVPIANIHFDQDKMREICKSEWSDIALENLKLGAKIALQGVKEEINNITEEMARKGIDTKYFKPLKAFVDDRLEECEINEKG